jgi:general stress protein 26
MAERDSSNRKSIEKLASLIKDIHFAMLTTVCRDGSLRSRPMATQHDDFDGVLWFFTDVKSAKVHEIEDDQHVNVSYADPGSNTYVSVSGRATLVRDKVILKELWNPMYKAYFPKGLQDPNVALLRVAVERAEYWDSPSSTLVQLGGFVKAVVTGRRVDGGENEKMTLRRPKPGTKSSSKSRGESSSRSSKRRPPRARAARR